MTARHLFDGFLILMVILALLSFSQLLRRPAGYGQYLGGRTGKTIPNRAGWLIMELPVVVLFGVYWLVSDRTLEPTPLVFFVLFNLHYCQRTFVFPLLIRGDDRMPWSIIGLGMVFNAANASMQGAWIFFLAPETQYTPAWLKSPQFIVGVIVFLTGFVINLHSDRIIRKLREPGDTGFHIPRGGMFEFVTAANYLGEIIEWVGWAILTLSWPGLVFAIWTVANLVPRARSHHEWYLERFGDEYPTNRRRVIPFLY